MAGQIKRIVIADDHDAIRRGLRTLLEQRSDLKVVAEAADGREALAAAAVTRPDIAILDYSLPRMNAYDLTVAIRSKLPRTEILIYTMHDRDDLIADVVRAGARALVLKLDSEKHVLAAVDALSAGRSYFSSGVSEALVERLLKTPVGIQSSPITRREREIVRLVAEGKINREISDALGISLKTVETHRAAAMRKLKLQTTAELVRYALRNAIVEGLPD